MSLLDFAVAFGAGAADSLAESTAARHRSKLEEQRQANLARLKAQHKREEIDAKVGFFADLESADPEARTSAQHQLRARGVDLDTGPKPTSLMIELGAIAEAEGYPRGSSKYNQRVAEGLRQNRLTPTPRTGPLHAILDDNGNVEAIRHLDHEDVEAAVLGGKLVVPLAVEDHVDPDTGVRYRRQGGLVLRDVGGGQFVPEEQLSGPFRPSVDDRGAMQNMETNPEQHFIDIDRAQNAVQNLPPGDYISFATGPFQALQRLGYGLPGFGDMVTFLSTDDGTPVAGQAQTRATATLELGLNEHIRANSFNSNRITNVDIEFQRRTWPKTGAFTFDGKTYEMFEALRDKYEIDIASALRTIRLDLPPEQLATQEARKKARDFLTSARTVLPIIDGYINAYNLQRLSIPVSTERGRTVNRPLIRLSQEEIMNLPTGTFANMSQEDRDLAYLYFRYRGWTE